MAKTSMKEAYILTIVEQSRLGHVEQMDVFRSGRLPFCLISPK